MLFKHGGVNINQQNNSNSCLSTIRYLTGTRWVRCFDSIHSMQRLLRCSGLRNRPKVQTQRFRHSNNPPHAPKWQAPRHHSPVQRHIPYREHQDKGLPIHRNSSPTCNCGLPLRQLLSADRFHKHICLKRSILRRCDANDGRTRHFLYWH